MLLGLFSISDNDVVIHGTGKQFPLDRSLPH